MTRTTSKKNRKRVKKFIKKLQDAHSLDKKHCEERIINLEMELWNKRYYISSMLNYLASISYNPWDRDVYKGFTHMCSE